MCLERGREELPPRVHDALARLIDQLDESHRIALDVVLDELAGDEVDESARLSRLRHIRKDIVKAFYEIRDDFFLQISSSKPSPAERLAWFAGDDLLARSLKERTEQIMVDSDAVYETSNHEPIKAISSAPASIVISYVGDDDQSEVKEFVNEIRTSLKAGNRGDLAESVWFSSGRTENRSRSEELRMINQPKLVVVLWSTKLHFDRWFSENLSLCATGSLYTALLNESMQDIITPA